MKKIFFRIVIGIVATILCIFLGFKIYTKMSIKDINIDDIPITKLSNGVYKGSASIKPVVAKVEVNIKNGKISEIKLSEHKTGFGKKGEKVINDIVKKQKIKVDTVSGATQSSVTIMKAVENALK